MSRFLPVLAMGVLMVAVGGCEPKYAITTSHTPLRLGDATVALVLHEAAAPGLTYLNLHDDENTSVEAALDVIGQFGGRVLELKHTGRRNMTFQLGDSSYTFDPNRMFTPLGRAASLDRFGPVSDSALAAVHAFADGVLQRLDPETLDVVITLHNNTENNYSALSYTADGIYALEARFAYITNDMDPDDFFFVTDRKLYDQLRQLEQNVVLQNNASVTDDGSLSVWSAQHQLPYVNVEAQHGHWRTQVGMIERLHEVLFQDSRPLVRVEQSPTTGVGD